MTKRPLNQAGSPFFSVFNLSIIAGRMTFQCGGPGFGISYVSVDFSTVSNSSFFVPSQRFHFGDFIAIDGFGSFSVLISIGRSRQLY